MGGEGSIPQHTRQQALRASNGAHLYTHYNVAIVGRRLPGTPPTTMVQLAEAPAGHHNLLNTDTTKVHVLTVISGSKVE